MIGLREPSGEEIARRAHDLYLQRGGGTEKMSRTGESPKELTRPNLSRHGENKVGPRRSQRASNDEPPMSKHLFASGTSKPQMTLERPGLSRREGKSFVRRGGPVALTFVRRRGTGREKQGC